MRRGFGLSCNLGAASAFPSPLQGSNCEHSLAIDMQRLVNISNTSDSEPLWQIDTCRPLGNGRVIDRQFVFDTVRAPSSVKPSLVHARVVVVVLGIRPVQSSPVQSLGTQSSVPVSTKVCECAYPKAIVACALCAPHLKLRSGGWSYERGLRVVMIRRHVQATPACGSCLFLGCESVLLAHNRMGQMDVHSTGAAAACAAALKPCATTVG
jgi:hypothetical protein